MTLAQTVLGFDYGARKIGVAAGQTLTGTATPVLKLDAPSGQPDWRVVQRLVQEWRPQVLLVGLPLNMDDSESALSEQARSFARKLGQQCGLPVQLVDERLSTREARSRVGQSSASKKRQRDPVDAMAAVVIVETWLHDQA